MNGLMEAWLDWTTPLASYRTEIDDATDLGEQVLLFVRDFARRE